MDRRLKRICVAVFIGFVSCYSQSKHKQKKEYYSSGNLKSYGRYLQDTIPVDTITTLYENGSISSKEVFDSIGNSIISIGYNKNGSLNKIINYKDGMANDFLYEFSEKGKIKNKYFYYNDQQVGDIYGFDKNGDVNYYGFLDFDAHNKNLITYDNKGLNILKDFRQQIFIDSLKLYIDLVNKDQTPFYNLLLIISNPPQCKSLIKIEFLSKNNSVIQSDSVSNKHYYFEKQKLPDHVDHVRITGSQYDSIKMKTIIQKSIVKLESE